MGNNPITPYKPPDRETFHIGNAKSAYVRGDLTIEEFEESVEHVLLGGHLTSQSRPPRDGAIVELPPGPEREVRRA